MYLIGDIGNTETKICLFNNKKKLLKKKILNTAKIKKLNFHNDLKFMSPYRKKIKKIIFSSVVPEVFRKLKKIIKNKFKLETKELKQFNLNKILKIDVDKKQVGSDRIANAISIINNKDKLKNTSLILFSLIIFFWRHRFDKYY